ncbi:universal stress protein [Corynebacterium lubricantis]|uniref:universal stress protein n=1 Tax=Corynebacterium lubricantis TaxID=541095 RepID=UPI00039AB28F
MSTHTSNPLPTSDAILDRPLRLLVAWDPGNSASGGREALEFAAWLGRSLPVTIRVTSTFLRPWPATMSMLGSKYQKWRNKESAACVKAVTFALKDLEVPTSQWDREYSTFTDGQNEAQLLTDEATRFEADLILLGSNAAATKGRFLASSTADTLMHSSPMALGLAPRAVKLSKKGVTRVNFAFLDNRSEDSPSLQFAADIADHLDVPLRIIAFSPTGIGDVTLSSAKGIGNEIFDEWNEHALGMLDLARDRVMEFHDSLDVETEIGTGKGWANAVDSLKWKKGDLLCMGSQPMGPLKRVFVGSTASEFLRHVPVPVVIHPHESA